jgi:tetratricopeptide (TPR) repeat protein
MRRGHVSGIVLVVWLAPGLVAGDESYKRLVETYAGGDRRSAVRELGERAPTTLVDAVEALLRELWSGWSDPRREQLLRAGALLHTEQAVLRQRAGDSEAASRHTELARSYVLLIDKLPRPTPGLLHFSRRFYLLQGLLGQAVLDEKKARSFFEEGLKRFPRYAPLLLALGSLEEDVPSPELREQRRQKRRAFLERAETLYRRVLAVEPALAEAQLRLGRVLHAQDRLSEAHESLHAVTETTRDPELQYLAHLFLGRIHEEAGRLDAAAAEYRAAVAASPRSQTGYLALSQSLDAMGDRRSALETLELALSRGDTDEAAPDPWCIYPFGQVQETQALFERMLQEAEP